MAMAVCIRCGEMKRGPFRVCEGCGFSPRGDRRAMAQSLVASRAYYDPETDWRPSRGELRELSERIRRGEGVDWDEGVIGALVEQQRVLEEEEVGWLRVVVLVVVMNVVPLAVLVYVLGRMI